MATVAPPVETFHADEWVPVDRRWHGIDRKTIRPAVISILLVVLIGGVFPVINLFVDYGREVEPGDVMNLGSGVTFVPAVGWGIERGLLTTDRTISGSEDVTHLGALVVQDGVTVAVNTGPYSGTAEDLLNDVNSLNDKTGSLSESSIGTGRSTVVTSSGIPGVAEAFDGSSTQGLIVTFVIDGIGVKYTIEGPTGSISANVNDIASMLATLDRSDVGASS